jgi:hypothetical protein
LLPQCLNQLRGRQLQYLVYQMISITRKTGTINNDRLSTKIKMSDENGVNQTV